MSEVVVRMSSDDAQLWASIQRHTRGFDQMDASTKRVGQSAKAAAKEHEALERAGKRVYEQTRTPQEQYANRLEHLNRLLRAHAISGEEHGRALVQAQGRLAEATHKVGEHTSHAGGLLEKAFGPHALQHVTGMVTGYLSLGAAIHGVMKLAEAAHKRAAAAGERQMAAAKSGGELAQIAWRDPGKMQQLSATSKKLRASGAVDNAEEANSLTRMLAKTDQMDQLDLFTRLGQGQVFGDLTDVAGRASAIEQAFGGRKKTGGARQIISEALGATESTRTSPEDVLKYSADFAGTATAAGISEQEMMAAFSLLGSQKSMGRKGLAATGALMAGLGNIKSLRGVSGLGGKIDAIGARGLSDKRLKEMLGGDAGLDAFRAISQQREGYQDVLERTRGAADSGAVDLAAEAYKSVPALVAAQARRAAKAGHEGAEGHAGTEINLVEAGSERMQQSLTEGGHAALAPTVPWLVNALHFGKNLSGLVEEGTGNPTSALNPTTGAAWAGSKVSGFITEKLLQAIEHFGESAEKLDSAAEHIERRKPNTQQHNE